MLEEEDRSIGTLLAQHGITELCAFHYEHESFRHLRKIFTGYVPPQWTSQDVDTEYLRIMRRVGRWLRDQSLRLYDKARIGRDLSFLTLPDGGTALNVQVDLYGNPETDCKSSASNSVL